MEKIFKESENRAYRVIYKHLSSIYARIKSKSISESPQSAIQLLNIISQQSWADVIAKIYETEGETFYLYQKKRLNGKKDFNFSSGFFSEIWRAAMNRIMNNADMFIRIKNITDLTRNDIRKVLQVAIDNRYGARDIAKLMSEQTGYIRRRSLRIARTEVTYAASLGKEQAANESTLPLLKVWVHGGGRTDPRQNHAALHKTKVKKNELFDMGNGKAMKYPGDPMGGAGETVNCTCSIVYIVDI